MRSSGAGVPKIAAAMAAMMIGLAPVSSHAFDSAGQAVVSQGDTRIRITLGEAKQIRSSLLDALKHSNVEDRDALVASAEPLPAWIDSDGLVMIGGWLLELRKGSLVATRRLSQECGPGRAYVAPLRKTGAGWHVVGILAETITIRC